MKLILVPDPSSPNGEDAFCREIAKRAIAHGHEALVRPAPGEGGDVVLINNLQPEAVREARRSGRKTVVRLVEDLAEADRRELALQCDLILVPSDHLARQLKAWGANGSVKRVPYAYDRIMAQQIAVVTVRASRPTGFQIVAAARLTEAARPAYETLLSALVRMRMECHLTIVGEGPARPALEERARQLALTDKVAFIGELSHVKLLEYFRATKAYVDPWGEDGFPALALHALSEGCPVVAARSGAMPELIVDGKNGLLFQPGDPRGLSEALVTLYSVRGLSLQLINEGIKTVEAHTWDATVSATFAALESLK